MRNFIVNVYIYAKTNIQTHRTLPFVRVFALRLLCLIIKLEMFVIIELGAAAVKLQQ